MALFSRTTKNKEQVKEVSAPAASKAGASSLNFKPGVILSPRVTEKATADSGRRVYTFNVSPRATKSEVRRSVEALWGVVVTKVSLTKIPRKLLFQRGKKGATSAGKKAYVTVAKGQQIEFV